MSRHWVFYRTTKVNLEKISRFVTEYGSLAELDRAAKIERLVDAIENAPKSSRGKMRGSIGTRQKWYREVEEVEHASNATE